MLTFSFIFLALDENYKTFFTMTTSDLDFLIAFGAFLATARKRCSLSFPRPSPWSGGWREGQAGEEVRQVSGEALIPAA